jgi:hypothetical protein
MISADRVRKLLEAHGAVESQSASDFTGDIPLPPALAAFYRDIGPADIEIDAFGDHTFLPRLSGLWDAQAGYRWDGVGEMNDDWPAEWIVVADERGDPFIFSSTTGKVYYAVHSAGPWEPIELFPDLPTMAGALALLGIIFDEAGDDIADLDLHVKPEYLARAADGLGEFLPDQASIQRVLDTLGWTG